MPSGYKGGPQLRLTDSWGGGLGGREGLKLFTLNRRSSASFSLHPYLIFPRLGDGSSIHSETAADTCKRSPSPYPHHPSVTEDSSSSLATPSYLCLCLYIGTCSLDKTISYLVLCSQVCPVLSFLPVPSLSRANMTLPFPVEKPL